MKAPLKRMPLYSFIALTLFCFTKFTFASPTEKPARGFGWEIALHYNSNSMEIVSAHSYRETKKTVATPGLAIAAETYEARLDWMRGDTIVATSSAEVPFGNRFSGECQSHQGGCIMPAEDTVVFRAQGPYQSDAGDTLQVTLLGKKSSFGVPHSELTSRKLSVLSYSLLPIPATPLSMRLGPVSVTKIVDNGSDSNRFVLVVVGDGYTAADISNGKYSQDVQSIINYLGTQSPWNILLSASNVYMINVESNQSGSDDPASSTTADTYFNTTFNTAGIDRLLAPDAGGKARAIAAAESLVGTGVWNSILMIVNTPKYGGSGGTISVSSMHPSASDIMVHEMGHSIGGLADEYSDPYPGYPDGTPEPNVDSNGSSPKWSIWIDSDVPLPTPNSSTYESVVGSFEGARYKPTGVYRPMLDCKMRHLGVPFCPICKEALTTSVLGNVSLIDGTTPSTSTAISLRKGSKKLTVITPNIQSIKVKWTVCGKALSTKSKSITLKATSLTKSRCDLVATVSLPTSLVRSSKLQGTAKWKIKR